VLYTAFSRDKSGRLFEYGEIMSLIAQHCQAPIYTTNEFNVGRGVVGGLLVHGYDQGLVAGKMALRILQGESVEDIPVVMTSPKRYVFDYAQMRRFDIAPDTLPAGSTVVNMPETLYFKYKKWIYGIIVTIAFLLSVISVLLASIRKRKRTERQLENSQEQLRSLTWRLARAQETERKMISRELHDQIGQNMTILGVNLNILRSLIPQSAVDLIEARINDSLTLVRQTTERIRHLMSDLRSPVLDDYGLAAAIDYYAKQCAQRTGLHIAVKGDEAGLRLPPPVESTVFRIVQEALTNVVKHAQASEVVINVGVVGNRLQVSVEDNGIGYDTTNLTGTSGNHGWGLLTMTERALAIGGVCRVQSRPGLGTHVIVEVPV
jgi:signal transduction histidine kinase